MTDLLIGDREVIQTAMRPAALRYNVVSAAAETAQHPASNLALQPVSPVDMVLNNEGWQSPPHCAYPLDIVLEIPPSSTGASCTLTQLHILAHETKIPSRVWIYIGNPAMTRDGARHIEYRKLGYTSLADNRDQAFAVREYKTVYLKDVAARFVRLAVAEPHPNDHNPGRQAGIVAINIMGHVGGGGVAPPPPAATSAAAPPLEPLSPDAAHRLLEWTRAACRNAEGRADARDAALLGEMKQSLTDAMEQLHHINTQINELGARKAQAVASEDYALAQQLHASLLSARGAMPPALEHLQHVAARIVQQQQQQAPGATGGGGGGARGSAPPRAPTRALVRSPAADADGAAAPRGFLERRGPGGEYNDARAAAQHQPAHSRERVEPPQHAPAAAHFDTRALGRALPPTSGPSGSGSAAGGSAAWGGASAYGGASASASARGCGSVTARPGELSFMYRYISRESCSQFDSLPLTSLDDNKSRPHAPAQPTRTRPPPRLRAHAEASRAPRAPRAPPRTASRAAPRHHSHGRSAG